MDRLGGDFGAFGSGQEFEEDSDDATYDDGAHSNPPPSPVGQDERRMQVRAYNHWSSLLGDQNLPHIEDLEPEFLGDFGPYSVLFDFSTGSGTPTLQFIGTELSRECCELDPIETLQEIPEGSLLSKIAEQYLKVVQAQAPVTFEAESPNARGRIVAYRGVLLPYSSDHDTIDFVYAVINWKEVADAQTADALFEEIDRAMDYGMTSIEEDIETEPTAVPTADIVHFASNARDEEAGEAADAAAHADEGDHWDSDDNILELRGAALNESGAFGDLPSPRFGRDEGYAGEAGNETGDEADSEVVSEDFAANDPAIYAAADSQPEEAVTEETPTPEETMPKRNRLTDALGNPIGGAPAGEEPQEEAAPGGITTAADYGLPEWDEDEPEEEDVDELVNPLADIDLNSRLLSLVNAGTRGKKTVDLATLSDTPEPEEVEEADASKLFRPKAPSVDSLLSPEPYEEEPEAEEAFEYVAEPAELEPETEAAPEYAPTAFEENAEAEVEAEPEPEFAGPVEAVETEATEVFEAVEPEETEMVEEAPVDLAEERQPLELADVEDESDGDFAPLELSEEAIVEETAPEEPVVETAEAPFELDEAFEVEESAELAPVETLEDGAAPEPAEASGGIEPCETAQEVSVVETVEPEGLTGLLAAVRDLTEAARTTDDLGRRALYEAVGRAFDVSIKAVIASGNSSEVSQDVIEHFPIDAVARSGPDMALVMVRRHANGETEVLGEVPHDSILMESAQRKLASQ